jgi:hypothetical protein
MKFLVFAFKSLSRNRVRTTLTLLGVGVAIFLFTGVVSLDQGMRRMLANSATDDTLVVFDKYQGCPPLSKLPTSYEAQVAELSGVTETTPTLFLLSACSRATEENFERLREILKASSDIDMALCTSLIRGCFDSDDYTEGRTAFMQKRKPVFTGR